MLYCANKTLINLVQGYDSHPTFPLHTLWWAMWLTNICTWFAALSILSKWRKRGGMSRMSTTWISYYSPWSTGLLTPLFPLTEILIVPRMFFFHSPLGYCTCYFLCLEHSFSGFQSGWYLLLSFFRMRPRYYFLQEVFLPPLLKSHSTMCWLL